MKKHLVLLLAALMLTAAVALAEPADTVIYANIYTSDTQMPWAQAVAIRDGVFTYVGDAEGVSAFIGENTEVQTYEQGIMTPNLIDAHTHPATVGMTNWHTRIGVPETYDELMATLRGYLDEHTAEEQPFVYFEYYPSAMFDTKGPRKEWLDEIAPDRPILVRDFSDHASWVNSKFLELCGVYALEEGHLALESFVRDETGDFTGWIKEFSYTELLPNMWEALGWQPDEEPTIPVMSVVTDDLKRWGVTGVFDAYLEDEIQAQSIHDMDVAGQLNMYYDMSVVLSDFADLQETIDFIHTIDETYGTEHVTMRTMKIFYDGTNELGDSALIDGTVEDPDNHGYMIFDYEQTKEVIRACNAAGIDVHFHLVGDLAFRTI